MTTAINESLGRPLRPVYGPEDARQVREALESQKGLWRAFLKAKGALMGALMTARQVASSTWARLTDNRLLRFAARTCGWALHGAGRVGHVLSRPGVRSGLLWAALTKTGTGVLRAAGKAVAKTGGWLLRPLAKAGSWLLRLAGGPGARVEAQVNRVVTAIKVRLDRLVLDVRSEVGPFLSRDSLPMQAVRNLLGARALSGFAKMLLPRPWNLLVRVVVNIGALPRGIRRSALSFVRGLFGGKPIEDTRPPSGPAMAQEVPPVVDLEQERTDRQAASQPIEQDVADMDAVVPTLQRYPAKKAAGGKHRR